MIVRSFAKQLARPSFRLWRPYTSGPLPLLCLRSLKFRSYSTKQTFDYDSFGREDIAEDAPQIKLESTVERGAKTATLLDGIREIMDANPDHVVLTQVGSFYEV